MNKNDNSFLSHRAMITLEFIKHLNMWGHLSVKLEMCHKGMVSIFICVRVSTHRLNKTQYSNQSSLNHTVCEGSGDDDDDDKCNKYLKQGVHWCKW